MIGTARKPMEEILQALDGYDKNHSYGLQWLR